MFFGTAYGQQSQYPKTMNVNGEVLVIMTLVQAQSCGINTLKIQELTELLKNRNEIIDTLNARCALLTAQVNTCNERIEVKQGIIDAQQQKEASYKDEVKRLKRKLTRQRIQKWVAVTAGAVLTYLCLK
jgi:peptidoglycan hydrolase CwlO-like protein